MAILGIVGVATSPLAVYLLAQGLCEKQGLSPFLHGTVDFLQQRAEELESCVFWAEEGASAPKTFQQ